MTVLATVEATHGKWFEIIWVYVYTGTYQYVVV